MNGKLKSNQIAIIALIVEILAVAGVFGYLSVRNLTQTSKLNTMSSLMIGESSRIDAMLVMQRQIEELSNSLATAKNRKTGTSSDLLSFVGNINTMVQESGLRLQHFNHTGTVPVAGEMLTNTKIASFLLVVDGTYSQVLSFLQHVEEMPVCVTLNTAWTMPFLGGSNTETVSIPLQFYYEDAGDGAWMLNKN